MCVLLCKKRVAKSQLKVYKLECLKMLHLPHLSHVGQSVENHAYRAKNTQKSVFQIAMCKWGLTGILNIPSQTLDQFRQMLLVIILNKQVLKKKTWMLRFLTPPTSKLTLLFQYFGSLTWNVYADSVII